MAADDLQHGEHLLQQNCASCHAIVALATASTNSHRHSVRSASAIRSSRWRRRWARASCRAILTCRNSSSTGDDVGDIIAYLKSIQQPQ